MRNLKKTLGHAIDTVPEILVYYIIVLSTAALLFSYFEDKPLFESFWWSCVTGLTIGYGDLYPVTVGGKVTAILLMHIVPLIIVPLIVARFLSAVVEDKNVFTDEEQEQLKADIISIKQALGSLRNRATNDYPHSFCSRRQFCFKLSNYLYGNSRYICEGSGVTALFV